MDSFLFDFLGPCLAVGLLYVFYWMVRLLATVFKDQPAGGAYRYSRRKRKNRNTTLYKRRCTK